MTSADLYSQDPILPSYLSLIKYRRAVYTRVPHWQTLGPALAPVKSPGSDASQDQDHSPPTPTPTELPLDANPLRGTACPPGSPPAAQEAARRDRPAPRAWCRRSAPRRR